MITSRSRSVVLALAGSALATSAAMAGFTTVQTSIEPTHLDIVNNIYGGGFAGSPATGFVGSGATAGVTLTRVDDFGLGGVLNLNGAPGDADDQVWSDGVISVSAAARYAGFSQQFGFLPGTDPSAAYTNLFNVSGSGYAVSGHATNFDIGAITHEWRWARNGTNGVHSSRNADNADGADHMVAYKVEGLGNSYSATWLLFFEDKNIGDANADWDYNDLVVELNVVAIPLPVPAALACAGLFGIAGVRRRSMA